MLNDDRCSNFNQKLAHIDYLSNRGVVPVGKWITFEGIGCSGKSTQVETIVGWLRESGFDAVATKEPGRTEVGAQLREMFCFVSSSTQEKGLLHRLGKAPSTNS